MGVIYTQKFTAPPLTSPLGNNSIVNTLRPHMAQDWVIKNVCESVKVILIILISQYEYYKLL